MESKAPKASPGWYPTPGGGQRYWDGNSWLDIPLPESTGKAEPKGFRPDGKFIAILLVALGTIALLVIAVIVGLNAQAEAEKQRVVAAQQAEQKRIQDAEDKRIRDEEEARQALLTQRQALVDELETFLNDTVVPEHISKRFVRGTPLGVQCSPVAGGSLSDTTEESSSLECFASLEDNGNGTFSGRYYDVTYNWTTGYRTWTLRN
jgi:hypothetical protein